MPLLDWTICRKILSGLENTGCKKGAKSGRDVEPQYFLLLEVQEETEQKGQNTIHENISGRTDHAKKFKQCKWNRGVAGDTKINDKMTSLAHQLKRLALPQNDSTLLCRKEIASLLFYPKQAASIDRDTFYALGCTGLEELIGIENAFEQFEETLFSQASKSLERSVQSKEVNKQLDEQISLFLTLLSPYFMLKPAHKCLEWLINRFHIHLYNQDSLIACALPYHETKVFVRVIQLLTLSDPTSKWNWLEPSQKNGVPLARGTLITHCYKDLGFMDFICNFITKSIKAYSGHTGSNSQLRVLFSFYASTIVPALDASEKITDTVIAKLLPYIQKGLKSSHEDYKAATYMIICQLAIKVVMEGTLVNNLVVQISKSLKKLPVLLKEGIGCLIVLLQNQKTDRVDTKSCFLLCSVPDLVSTLQSISESYDSTSLLSYLLPNIIRFVISGEETIPQDDSSEDVTFSDILDSILHNLTLENDLDHLIAKYSKALDSVLEGYLKDIDGKKEQELFHHFISLSMSTGKYKILTDSNTSLLLSLNHPQSTVRNLATRQLKEIIASSKEGFDQSFLKEAVLSRLEDETPEVVMTALNALEMYVEHLGPQTTVSSLLSLFGRVDLARKGQWLPVFKEAVRILDSDELLKENEDSRNQAAVELLPYLIITSPHMESAEQQFSSYLSKTKLLGEHPLVKGWSKALEDVFSKYNSISVVGAASITMITTFAKNLSLMKESSKLKMLDDLIQLSEKQSGLQGRAAFYVFMYIIVQGIQALNGNDHLERASKVFGLIELHLRKLFASEDFLNDPESCSYMRLLIGIFDVVISGASQGEGAFAFRNLMKLLLKSHFGDPVDLFRFLSLMWTYNFSLTDTLSYALPALLQTQALYVGSALLGAQTVSTMKQLASAPYLVPSLLVNLGSPVREVRRASIACFQAMAEQEGSHFFPVIEKILKCTEEITADPSHVTQAIGALFEEDLVCQKPKSHQKKLATALNELLKCISSPDCPSYVARALLKLLNEVNSEAILSALLPALERLLLNSSQQLLKDEVTVLQLILGKYNKHSSPLLIKNDKSLELFIKAMNATAKVYQGFPKFQTVALEQITKEFFASLPEERIQQRLLGVMFDLLVDCKDPQCVQTVNSVFKAITVDAELIANELYVLEKPKTTTVQQTRRQKMQQQRKSQVPEDNEVNWQRVTLILELLQHKKKLKRPQLLVPSLFVLLSRCSEHCSPEEEDLEYTKQLVLSCLTNICQKLSPEGGRVDKGDGREIKVKLEGGNLGEKVLHNIMPIFTFMGANIMRLDDTYSFQVITKTVHTVIPALIQANDTALPENSGNIENVVNNIINVFVDALPHVPEHRRLPILSHLLSTVGPERFLWVLLLLLFKQHVTKTVSSATNEEKDAALERDVEFWISLCSDFQVQEQLISVIKILQYLPSLPDDKEEGNGKTRNTKKKSDLGETVTMLFNTEEYSGKELRHYKFLTVSFVAKLLASSSFIGKVADIGESLQDTLQRLEQSLLEEILRYINSVAASVEKNSDKPTAKFWRALLNKSYDVLDKVNSLLPNNAFIPVIKGLMGNQLPSVRRKAMDLLNNKLQHRVQWQDEQVIHLLELSEDLLLIAQRKQHMEEEQAINRQTALYSLKLLCRCFGAEHQQHFVPVLRSVVDLVMSREEEKNVLGSALLCIAEVTSVVKALAIPELPRLMPAVIKSLKDRKELLSNEIYLLSMVTTLQKVSEALPHFISPYLMDIILLMARLKKITLSTAHCIQFNARLTSLQTTLVTKLAPRVLLPIFIKCYSKLVDSRMSHIGPLMEIFQDHIKYMQSEQLKSSQSELTNFFLKALDFRSDHSEIALDQICEIEGHLVDCLLVMVMKLSEVTFRPLFFRLFDWCKTEGAPKDRLLTFCRLADRIADKLKGLFLLFAGHLVKPFSNLLNQTNLSKTDEPFFDSEDNTEKSCLMLHYILDCLHKIFLYDTRKFVSKERAEFLMMPLIDQLENMLGGEESFQTRVTEHLIPCVAQFSVAVGDDAQWKQLNYQILLKTRHSLPKIRFAALIMLMELAGKLRENYMVLLPETIPFLAELMEDECEEVEQQCHKVIQQLEVILGEPLQSYF
ncbi:HEAT1 protein, partial [Polypterus senegalus]|nr:HEAT1 protein [Polypterus senegalus]